MCHLVTDDRTSRWQFRDWIYWYRNVGTYSLHEWLKIYHRVRNYNVRILIKPHNILPGDADVQKFSKKTMSCLKTLCPRRVTCWKFHAGAPQVFVLGPSVHVYVGSSRDDPAIQDLWTADSMHDTSRWANCVWYAGASLMFSYYIAVYSCILVMRLNSL